MLDAVVQEIRGDENGVQEVEVRNTATEKTSVIPANGVFYGDWAHSCHCFS